jgi:hypothetical protein
VACASSRLKTAFLLHKFISKSNFFTPFLTKLLLARTIDITVNSFCSALALEPIS